MRQLRERQAAACSEARSIERSWISSLARWAGQLVKARAAAVGGEVGELRILQREDAEVSDVLLSSYYEGDALGRHRRPPGIGYHNLSQLNGFSADAYRDAPPPSRLQRAFNVRNAP